VSRGHGDLRATTFVFAISTTVSQPIVPRRTSTAPSLSGVVPRLSTWRLTRCTSVAHIFRLPIGVDHRLDYMGTLEGH